MGAGELLDRALGEAEEQLLEGCRVRDELADADARGGERDRQVGHDGRRRDERDAVVGEGAALDAAVPAHELDGLHVVGRREPVALAARCLEARDRALVDDPPAAHDGDAVAQLLDLGELVAREQHRDPLRGEPLDQRAHVAHARGIEAGRRLVQQQQPWPPDQRGRDAEPLSHAVRVAADLVTPAAREVDDVERLLDAVAAHRRRPGARAARGSRARGR